MQLAALKMFYLSVCSSFSGRQTLTSSTDSRIHQPCEYDRKVQYQNDFSKARPFLLVWGE